MAPAAPLALEYATRFDSIAFPDAQELEYALQHGVVTARQVFGADKQHLVGVKMTVQVVQLHTVEPAQAV